MARTRPDSGVTFEDIERKMGGYTPEARVFLQEIDENGQGGPFVREIKGWSSVTTNIGIQGQGAATIVLPNPRDTVFKHRYVRQFGHTSDTDQQDARVTTQYLQDILGRTKGHIRFNDPTRRREAFKDEESFLREYIDTTYDLFVNATTQLDKRNQSGDLVSLGVLQRVYIDLVGRDGQVYAGFSGVLSSISDASLVGEMPSVLLTCKDYWRFFQFTELIVRQGPGLNQLEESVVLEEQKDMGLLNFYQSSQFDGMAGPQIIRNLINVVQSTFCAQAFSHQKQRLDPTLSPAKVAALEDQFFYKERFLNCPEDGDELLPTYSGTTPLRKVKSAKLTSHSVHIRGKRYALGETVPAKKDGVGIEDGDMVQQLAGDVLVDLYMGQGIQAEVYRRTIEHIMQPFQSQRARGDAILRKVAEATMYDMFFNGNGDLVYQIPKYNNFPGEYDPTFIESVVSTSSTDPDKDDGNKKAQFRKGLFDYDFSISGDFDYSPAPEHLPMKCHGFNYVLSDLSLKGWNLLQSEEPMVTSVRVPAGFNFITVGETLSTRYITGITRLKDTRALQRRFGVRSLETQQIFLSKFISNGSRKANEKQTVTDLYALALMNQINAAASTGTVQLTFRPDLNMGCNVFLLERQKLFYVTTVNHTIPQGGEASTTLQVGFGHDIGERIRNPWAVANESLSNTDNVDKLVKKLPHDDEQQDVIGPHALTQKVMPVPGFPTTDGILRLPRGRKEMQDLFGEIKGSDPAQKGPKDYVARDDNGHVTLTNGFEGRYIRKTSVPINGQQSSIRIHVFIKDLVIAVFNDIQADQNAFPRKWAGKYVQITDSFNPRHVYRKPEKVLSTHSWGLALDVYVVSKEIGFKRYKAGQIYELNKLIVPFFAKHKFFWGGDFPHLRDDIHWQWLIPDGFEVMRSNDELDTNDPE